MCIYKDGLRSTTSLKRFTFKLLYCVYFNKLLYFLVYNVLAITFNTCMNDVFI